MISNWWSWISSTLWPVTGCHLHWKTQAVTWLGPKKNLTVTTLPETNSSPLKIGHPKRKPVFQPSIFRGYASFREGNWLKSYNKINNSHVINLVGCLWSLTPGSYISYSGSAKNATCQNRKWRHIANPNWKSLSSHHPQSQTSAMMWPFCFNPPTGTPSLGDLMWFDEISSSLKR